MTQKLVLLNKRTSAPPLDPGGQGLFDRLTYVGSARFPNHKIQEATPTRSFGFMRNYTFCYDPVNDNFLAGCHQQYPRRVIRMTLPTPQPHNGTVSGLPTGSVLMADWVDITDGQFTNYGDNNDQPHWTGNIFVHDGKIWWVQEPNYNVSPDSHPVIGHSDNTADLTNLNAVPPWETTGHYKRICRCLCVIGETWANAHVGGKRFLMAATTGVAGNVFCSFGPGAVAVEVPTAPGQTLTEETLSFWPIEEEEFIWPTTGLKWHDSHRQAGVAWIEDGADNWVIMSGVMNEGMYGYKTSTPCGTSGGFTGYPWVPYLMVLHADDFLPVIAGTSPTGSRLYYREMIDCRSFWIRDTYQCYEFEFGVAWDAARKRLWVLEPRVDEADAFTRIPVAHALDLDAA